MQIDGGLSVEQAQKITPLIAKFKRAVERQREGDAAGIASLLRGAETRFCAKRKATEPPTPK